MTSARFALILAAAFPALSLAACATSVGAGDHGVGVQVDVPATLAQGDDVSSHRITIGLEHIEFGAITVDSTVLPAVDVPDIERATYRLRYRVGTAVVGYYGGLFLGEFDMVDTVFDVFGGEIGVGGTPRLEPNSDLPLILDYDGNLSVHHGTADLVVAGIGTIPEELDYVELSGRIGVGVDHQGFQLSGGFAGSLLLGHIDASAVGFSSNTHVEATNLAGYARAAYAAAGSPLFVEIIGFGGDISGVTVNGGVQF